MARVALPHAVCGAAALAGTGAAAHAAVTLIGRLASDMLGQAHWQQSGAFGGALTALLALGKWSLGVLLTSSRDTAPVGDTLQASLAARSLGAEFTAIATAAFDGKPALFGGELREQCLWCLALMPRGHKMAARVDAFRSALKHPQCVPLRAADDGATHTRSGSCRVSVRATALKLLPLLLIACDTTGVTSAPSILKALGELLKLAAAGATPVVKALAGCVGAVACAASCETLQAARRVVLAAGGDKFDLKPCKADWCGRAADVATGAQCRGLDDGAPRPSTSLRTDKAITIQLLGRLRPDEKHGKSVLCAWLHSVRGRVARRVRAD